MRANFDVIVDFGRGELLRATHLRVRASRLQISNLAADQIVDKLIGVGELLAIEGTPFVFSGTEIANV